MAETVKLTVTQSGVHEVTAAQLEAVGFSLANLGADELSLTNEGEPVAFQVVGGVQIDAIRFYGAPRPAAAHTEGNTYWLRARDADPAQLPMLIFSKPAKPDPAAALTDVITGTVQLEQSLIYLATAPAYEDRWLWATIFAPDDLSVDVALPDLVESGESGMRLRVRGNSSGDPNPDHHLFVTIGDLRVADLTWDGVGFREFAFSVPPAVLASGSNTVRLRLPGDTGAPVDSVSLDWIEVSYARKMVLSGGQLAFAGSAGAYELVSRTPLVALWDITDPRRPVELTDSERLGNGTRFGLGEGASRFIAVEADGLLQVPLITPAAGADLRDWPGGADLLIVTRPEFHDSLQPLVTEREAQGLRVALVDIDAVYDTFSEGQADPGALRSLVSWSVRNWAPLHPRYLLLAGDASYDPRGYLGGSERDLVPTMDVFTTYSGWTASDVWFALADDDLATRLALAVGRLPAQNAGQMRVMVQKILAYEGKEIGAAWRERVFILADDDESGFTQEAETFATLLSGLQTEVVTIEGDGAAARTELLSAFREGSGLIGYFGHGSVNVWSQEKVLSVADVAELANGVRQPILWTLTCLTGFFAHPKTVSLGEALLRQEDGGAVAALVPSSAGLLADQRMLGQGLARSLAGDNPEPRRLGDIVLDAQTEFAVTSPGTREILLTFNLLGDPSMILR